jgi:hypothetical protein
LNTTTITKATILWLVLAGTALANTFGSVEPIASQAVVDIGPLRNQSLDVREAFADRLLQCGIVDRVIATISSAGSVTTINGLNTRVQVGAGGFAGHTNPSYVYTIIDRGPNAASFDDIKVLTDSLAYVMSQDSAFLLDADDADSFDFPAQYVVLNFATPPPLPKSAALFETVGRIDSDLFATDTSGYTQFGRAYLSLQSAVDDARFIAGYVQAAAQFGVEYTPIVNSVASLFVGGAAFPGNDWTVNRRGEEYLARIPAASHQALQKLRTGHLQFTRDALRLIDGSGGGDSDRQRSLRRAISELKCR